MGLAPWLPLQVLEHGEYPSVQLGLGTKTQPVKDRGHVILDRADGDRQFSSDSSVRSALGHEGQDLALARCEIAELPRDARSRDQALDDLGVERRPPERDTAHGAREQRQIPDPILQQVANALGAVADEFERISGFQVLREDHDADFGTIHPYFSCRAQAIVGVPGRHLNIRHNHVGLVCVDLASQVARVAGHSDYLKSGIFEHRHDARANERLILADDDPYRLGIAHAPTLRQYQARCADCGCLPRAWGKPQDR